MRDDRQLSRASVLRMQLYLEALDQFRSESRVRVTSAQIGLVTGVSPEMVRQDLFRLGSEGRPKVGYEVAGLADLIRAVFDLETEKRACLVGLGNLGRALAGSTIWTDSGFELKAIFDNDPAIVGSEARGLKVRSIAEVFGVIRTEEIAAGVIATPAAAAQETADLMVTAGIRGIWNFAPVRLHVPEGIVVENQSLAWGLIRLSYGMKSAADTKVVQGGS